MFSKFLAAIIVAETSVVVLWYLLSLSDSAWGTIVTGLVAVILGWMQMQTKRSADAAVIVATKAASISEQNKGEIKEVKVLATTAVKQGNSATLIQLEMYEVLAKQLAEKHDATQQDIDLHQRAMKAIAVHKEMQRKVDEEAKQVLADERSVAQATVAKAVQIAANEATQNMSTNPKTGD